MAVVTFLLGLIVGLASAALIRRFANAEPRNDELAWELEEFRF